MDAQNAPTAPWKTLRVFHELPQGFPHPITHDKPRKSPESYWETRIDPSVSTLKGLVMEGYLAETIKANLDIISHIQIAGVPGRREPDDTQEINYPYLFDVLDDGGYDRWVACEYRPLGDTLAGLKWAHRYGIDPSSPR